MLNCQRVCVYIYKRVLSIIYHAMIMIMVYVGKTSWDVMVRFLGQNADGKKWWCDGDIIEKSHDLLGYGGMKTIKHMEINVSTIVTWIYLIIIWEYFGIKQKRKNTQVHNIYWEHSRCFFFQIPLSHLFRVNCMTCRLPEGIYPILTTYIFVFAKLRVKSHPQTMP